MSTDALLYVMAGAVVVSALALILQALMLVGVYKSTKALRETATRTAGQVESLVESLQRSQEQTRKQISEVATKAGEVLDLAHKQLIRIDDVLGDAVGRARIQMDRVELILDDSIGKLQETTALLQKGILRPVREINGVAAGVQAALSFLFRSQRMTVEQATHDEEMFI
ncbi:MAG: hypothetical protein EHM65_06435 [Acidobacteriales bacterium]|nr:MAG: hypothetical protein EHM65_06435 [Terriglobales bacterium]